ncbi:zinc-binding dehydrogenase [Pantoea sp. 1.19]|uniref:zinc-binding dehydrogenase n=1 Tax=Pantoea sp. 1.19 TaxID=1925589 RepID=UPI000948FAFD|nr:zinc-binding dehydrogenase [Pantoea sp. 1.19]
MRSAVHHVFGQPGDVLQVEDTAIPAPGPGEVRINMRLSAIHNHDLLTVSGDYGYKPTLPAIGGSEGVGIVDALGDGVSHLQIGQRVAVGGCHGTWAEYFIANAASAVPMPEAIDDRTAAQLIGMPLSALHLLQALPVSAGEWMIQNAATGAVAKTLSLVAQYKGINVISLVRRQSAVAELSALGIRNVVATERADWQKDVRALVGEQAIVAGVDSVGGQASAEMARLLGRGALLLSFGMMSGEAMVIPQSSLIFNGLQVKGFWLSQLLTTTPAAEMQANVAELLELVIRGVICLQVSGVYDLADIQQAVRASVKPGAGGKVLVSA